MREILFRGKQNEGRWVEGVYFKHDTVKVCFSSDDPKPRHLIIQDGFCDWGFEPPIHCVDVDPDTVGQFTGLTDKNGKKIFEGDILDHIIQAEVLTNRGVVVWDRENARWALQLNTMKPCFYMHNPKSVEVIGNIHDNPELLKEE